ncbi:signal peptidase I [Marinicauda salina]|uniref:Signal peptidase I n=1 Tax=Marinicauda salina TaxID=2135793 RepID=A0A2U2BUD1_9PROT|nr:signal peptidase I [Marinicauda salina]PWE17590.1 signal peptidase I [Marinicauda salina]
MNETVTRLARRAADELGETVRFFAGVAAVWFVLVTFVFAAFHIPSESMQPVLQVGDRVLVSKWAYGYSRHSLPLGLGYLLPDSWSGRILGSTPRRGDVIVVRDPDQGINLIKRVVGLPGDRIEVRAGRLYINDGAVPREPVDTVRYRDRSGQIVQAVVYEETLPNGVEHAIYERSDSMPLDDVGPFTVPQNHLFLMGDNRDASADSRVATGLGYVHMDEVVGRAETVLFTFASCRREPGLHCPPWRVWRPL